MAKISKLKNDAVYYFDKAVKLTEEGQYLQAIDLFYKAYEKDDGQLPITIEIANCYKMLEEYETALEFYYKVVANDSKNEHAFVGIITSLIALDRNSEAIYFINHCEGEKIIGDQYEVDVSSKTESFHILDRYDKSAVISLARRLMLSGEYEYAREILSNIPKQSPQYIEALNLIAMIYLGQEKYVNSALVCDEVLAISNEDIYALTSKTVAMFYLKNKEEVDKTVAIIEKVDPTDKTRVGKVAVCMQQIENDELALKYYLRLSKFKPYDRNTNLAVGILYHNLGENEKSHKTMVRLSKLYPGDEIVLFYARELYYSQERFRVLFDLPQKEQERRLKEIESKLTKLKEVSKVTKYATNHEDFYNLIKWLLFSDQIMFSSHVANFLAQHVFWHPLIREMLASSKVNYYPKRECLGTFLRFATKKSFVLYVQDVLQFIKPRKIKCKDEIESAEIAYWNLYANLVFLLEDFNKDINKVYKHFCKVVNADYFKKEMDGNAMSALFAFISELHPIFQKQKTASEIFGTTMEKLEDYIVAYNITEGFDDD